MEIAHQDILIRLRKNIIDDLDIENDIIRSLTAEYILREEDIRRIYTGDNRETKTKIFLDILPYCGPNAFDVFHQSLKHHYEWLSDEIDKLLGNYEIETNGEIDYYIGPPNIPPLSPLTVTREEKINQLKTALQQLNSTEYIALHGMKGFGKSCLTASTLKDKKLVKNLFSNKVYWINFACDRPIDEEILIQLNTLYRNVRNLEIQPELFTPLDKYSLIQFLKHHFNQQDNRNALLILDDVFDEKIISTFDFGCKTLVLTADIDVLCGKRSKIIAMNDGFTETETLGLFAKVLEIDKEALPIEAKKIHEECKGMPLLIAMFAAQFEEFKHDMRLQPDRWRYYLQSLKKKDATNRVMRQFFQKQETIFDMCIEQLRPDLKKQYESLAIFSEDVNISPKTLEILWGQNIFQVEEVMLDLCHKSLAAKKWNKNLKTYIYGVHDLLLCHLRKKLTQDELTQMHKCIIEKYRKHCRNDFSKLPDDNYIFSYIGYHLQQAKLYNEFSLLYLDLDFIQAKIMHTSLSDILLDLKKYREYITFYSNDEFIAKVVDIERFLQEQAIIIGEHRRKKCFDIIQIAMNHPYQGYIAQTARNLAKIRDKYLYLSHDKNIQYINTPLTEEILTGICTSSCTDDPNLILVGNTMGKIILYNCENKRQKEFNGHSEDCSIKKIIVSTNGDCFLSLSSTGIIKLFLLLNDELDQNHMHCDSPRQKQSAWSGFFGNHNRDDSLVNYSVKNEVILDMAFGYEDRYIAACTDNATIQIWNRHGETMFYLQDPKYESITKIAFTAQASLLHIMDESKGAFVLYSSCENDYTTYRYLACYNLQLKNEKVILFHHVPKLSNSLIIVTERKAMYVKWWWSETENVHSFSKQIKGLLENDAVTYVCAATTYDGKYIVIADSAGFINIWDSTSGFQSVARYKSRVTSLDTYCLKDEGHHIICGSGDRFLYRWKFLVQDSNDLPRENLFDAIVESSDKMDLVVKEIHSKKIVVSRGEETIAESESTEGKILKLKLCPDGKKVVYVTEKYSIVLFDITTGANDSIIQLKEPIEFLEIIDIHNRNIIICGWTNDSLKVWQRSNMIMLNVSVKGPITHIHKINDNHVITITQSGIIMIWYTKAWELTSQVNWCHPYSRISFSCLSRNKIYLAVLNCQHQLALYTFDNITVLPAHIQINKDPYLTYTFGQKTTYCDISQNEQYIAIGFKTGQISIIDIYTRTEITVLCFHSSPITQLSWAPTIIDAPILFSLTSDELVWWNIALTKKKNVKRRSRMGINHSISTPSFSTDTPTIVEIPSSRSIDNGVSNLQDNKESSAVITNVINGVSKYWKNKIGKDPEIPGLLAAVESPPNQNTKVYISSDFSKFVTFDMYGSINTFKLFDYEAN